MLRKRSAFTILVAGLLLAFVLLAGCQSSDSPHKLLIYTPHGQDMLRDFVARYKQAHPEVEVQFLDMGSREVLERLRAERNRPLADIWWGAAHMTFKPRPKKIYSHLIGQRGPTRSLIRPPTHRVPGTEPIKTPKFSSLSSRPSAPH